MAFPVFQSNYSTTAYGKYNYSTQTYYHPSSLYEYGSQPGAGEIYCAEQLGSPSGYTESRDSPAQSTRTLRVVGTYDRNVALECVRGWLSLNLMALDSNIPLRSLSINMTSDGAPIWECTLEYANPQRDDENVYFRFCEVSMTTTGGSASVDSSLMTLAAVSAIANYPAQNYCRLLNVGQDGSAQPIEIKVSTVQINVALNWPSDLINEDYLLMLADSSCSVNSTYWFGFAPGALLFEGANIERVTGTDPFDNTQYFRWKVTYSFLGEKNKIIVEPTTYLGPTMFPYQSTIVVPKRGWDYLWRSYATTMVNGFPETILRQVNVEQMYPYMDFSLLGIPPSLFM